MKESNLGYKHFRAEECAAVPPVHQDMAPALHIHVSRWIKGIMLI